MFLEELGKFILCATCSDYEPLHLLADQPEVKHKEVLGYMRLASTALSDSAS